jgi:hypothetical protein
MCVCLIDLRMPMQSSLGAMMCVKASRVSYPMNTNIVERLSWCERKDKAERSVMHARHATIYASDHCGEQRAQLVVYCFQVGMVMIYTKMLVHTTTEARHCSV